MFGFQSYPQKPTPNRRQVGEALLMQQLGGAPEQGMEPGAPMGAHSPAGQVAMPDAGAGAGAVGDAPERSLREQGGRYMGATGQMGWGSGMPAPGAEQEANPSAIAAAVGEALTRQGGGIMRDRNPYVDRERRRQDVLRLGLSEFEADLLSQTGGI